MSSVALWNEQHAANLDRRRARLDPASSDRADAMAKECRTRLIQSVQAISEQCRSKNPNGKLGILLSGGVDSCAILEAAKLGNVSLEAAVTVSIVDGNGNDNSDNSSSNDLPQDELYATEAARCYNERLRGTDGAGNGSNNSRLHHSIVRLSPAKLVQNYSRSTIETLALWGYMETRNSLIMSAALEECRKLGLTDVLTGDNADELLGGSYDWYFQEKYADNPEGWITKRNDTADLPFVTNKLAAYYKLALHQPFRDPPNLLQWATEETTRNDCIDVYDCCQLQSEFGGSYTTDHNCGKLPLREAFCTVSSWRTMDWIFQGSGAGGANGHTPLVDHYETLYSDAEFEKEQARYLLEEGIKLQSKEHLHNIRVFRDVFSGFHHPTKERYPIGDPRGCVSCCFAHEDEQFCHLCDEYPAQHPTPPAKTIAEEPA